MYQTVLQLSVVFVFLSHLFARQWLHQKSPPPDARPFAFFQASYLLVYLLAVAADWLQGPYIYALYAQYGFANADIGRLYIAGFASSAIFGTVVAALADRYGRRNNVLLYCILYAASCLTKHSPNYYLLLLGRVLGGVAYSILSSAFESWLVYEHTARKFHPSLLASTFARAQFWNGVVAIAAGQVSGWFALRYGKVMPFDISVGVLFVLFALVAATWTENYGDRSQSVRGGFKRAWSSLMGDEKILLLGVSQSAFEGALYTFTFMWTPALQTATGQLGEIPHGTVFSSFMAATMIGSNLFAYCSRCMRVERLMRNVFLAGAGLFLTAALSRRIEVVYGSFLVFELLCGVYFPGMGTMRAPYVPEESRSALLTFFRVPLNVIVVFALYQDMSVRRVFFVCAGLMAVAAGTQQRLIAIVERRGGEDDELYKMEKALQT